MEKYQPMKSTMEKYQPMKSFIGSALEYSRNRSEKTASALQRHLQILAVMSDMSVFDPGSSITTEFYVSLHELMCSQESKSVLVWSAISVLQHACQNPAARAALIHTYKFTPILSRLLGAQLIHDKRLRVLQLLQELTYGVKISWQEAHLPFLISTLTQWIVKNEKEVIGLSLGILVNLCYKNLPAVYTLMRSVDSKQFLRTILRLQHDNVNTRVQVCKLLIILEHISGEIPASDILNLVNVTFSTLEDAFKARDVFLLRHIVDFFNDIRTNPHSCEVLRTYSSYQEDTQRLLSLLDIAPDHACVGMLFEFFQLLITLQVAVLNSLYPCLVSLALKWIQSELACTQALSLIRTIVLDIGRECSVKGVSENVNSQLDQGLLVLMLILDTGGDDFFPTNSETRARLTALLQLLHEMCKTTLLRVKILDAVSHQLIHKVFHQLLSTEPCNNNNLFQGEVTGLYVHALDFISDLASHDAQWMNLYSDLLQNKQVQMVLAVALYTGNETIKRQVLTLTGTVGFPAESVSFLAKSLCDLEPLVMLPSGSSCNKNSSMTTCGLANTQHDMTPLFSMAQEGRLDEFIERLKDVLEKNEVPVKDIPMSAVMELYEYKLAALGHSERALHASLEAANNHSTHLQHRLAQMSAEASRLHQLLYHSQQTLEGLQQEKKEVMRIMETAQGAAEEAHTKHVQEVKSKQRLVNELNGRIEDLRRTVALKNEENKSLQIKLDTEYQKCEALNKQVSENFSDIKSLENKLKDQTIKITDLTKLISRMEEKLSKRERTIQEKDAELDKSHKNIQALRGELGNLELVCKGQEASIQEKESQLHRTQDQLSELQRMREIIFEISAGKKKMDK